jgi:hypothetical protein
MTSVPRAKISANLSFCGVGTELVEAGVQAVRTIKTLINSTITLLMQASYAGDYISCHACITKELEAIQQKSALKSSKRIH